MKRLRILLIVVLMAVAMPMMQACSDQQPPPPPDQQTQQQAPPPAYDPVEPDSVLGSGLHFVGTVIMFPFRLIGDTLGLIF
jgi:hypothetical protein